MPRFILLLSAIALGALGTAAIVMAGKPGSNSAGLLPDMRTVVPTHLQIVNQQQRDVLRFSNGIANTGPGPWALTPDPPLDQATSTVTAVQEIRDANAFYECNTPGLKPGTPCYNVVSRHPTSTFEFHPSHNHWHIGDVALFEVREGSPTGPIAEGLSRKFTFCLIDWYKLDDNPKTPERVFFDCYKGNQGISSGWVDQYHQSTDGQQLDITDLPDGDDYYLVSTANYTEVFLESDYTNNTAWVGFRLSSDSKGNRKIELTGEHSPCESPGLCGERSTNR
jgi:hypothetical protein